VIELPAGLVGDEPGSESEGTMVAAGRELEEETGYRTESLEPLTEGPSSAGMSDETLHFVRARKITRVGTGGGTGDENITVHQVPVDQVPKFLASCQKRGARTDPKIFAALWFLSQEEA
jgi:ADP-ribose pyrophosphatase